jgi:hypothetical protein
MWLVEDRKASTDLTFVIETAVCVSCGPAFPGNFKGCKSWGSKPRCVYTACLYT